MTELFFSLFTRHLFSPGLSRARRAGKMWLNCERYDWVRTKGNRSSQLEKKIYMWPVDFFWETVFLLSPETEKSSLTETPCQRLSARVPCGSQCLLSLKRLLQHPFNDRHVNKIVLRLLSLWILSCIHMVLFICSWSVCSTNVVIFFPILWH